MKDSFLWLSGSTLSRMRLLIEKAATLMEKETSYLLHLATEQELHEAPLP